jgi:hypothetical protein
LALALEQLINGLRAIRTLKTDSHQAEGVGSVARKIVVRSESDMPMLVPTLMVITQAGNSGLCRFLVEKTHRQNAPHSLDPLHCCTSALIGDHHHIKARILKVVAVTLAGDVVGVDAIMKQITDRI